MAAALSTRRARLIRANRTLLVPVRRFRTRTAAAKNSWVRAATNAESPPTLAERREPGACFG